MKPIHKESFLKIFLKFTYAFSISLETGARVVLCLLALLNLLQVIARGRV